MRTAKHTAEFLSGSSCCQQPRRSSRGSATQPRVNLPGPLVLPPGPPASPQPPHRSAAPEPPITAALRVCELGRHRDRRARGQKGLSDTALRRSGSPLTAVLTTARRDERGAEPGLGNRARDRAAAQRARSAERGPGAAEAARSRGRGSHKPSPPGPPPLCRLPGRPARALPRALLTGPPPSRRPRSI